MPEEKSSGMLIDPMGGGQVIEQGEHALLKTCLAMMRIETFEYALHRLCGDFEQNNLMPAH
jgi:hypothetical protein